MTDDRTPIENVTPERLEARIREIARRLFADQKVDELETWHLAQVVEHCSREISDIYGTVNLDQILRGELARPGDLEDFLPSEPGRPRRRLRRLTRVPDTLRGVADRCLYDVGMAGLLDYQGLSLETLGVCSYRMAADLLAILANERDLRELFQRNRLRTLPIEEEIRFLRQCALRFQLHSHLLASLRGEEAPPAHSLPWTPALGGPPDREKSAGSSGAIPASPVGVSPSPRPSAGREPRERLLSRYERILLFGETDLEVVRAELRCRVIDQGEAVDALCDDLLLNAAGTQIRGVPQSYFLVGPTGVGKNHLMESLAAVLEGIWKVEIPFLVIEGPQYTHPSDISELKGAARGFIRSDEPGILSEFHERSSRSPLSVLIVDEVEKAHPQLQKFFLPIMDRGTTLDNRGRELGFEGTLLAFTSNLGYSTSESEVDPIGYQGGVREGARRRGPAAERVMRRTLSPEFTARLRVIRFSPLSRASMEGILDLELAKVLERFRVLHELEIVLTPEARKSLLELGFSEIHGARHLAGVVRRHCNVEVCRRIKQDEIAIASDKGEVLEALREIRRGDRAFEAASMERTVADQARIRLPYRRLAVDFAEGAFVYRGEG